jgi:hypothetical protein
MLEPIEPNHGSKKWRLRRRAELIRSLLALSLIT